MNLNTNAQEALKVAVSPSMHVSIINVTRKVVKMNSITKKTIKLVQRGFTLVELLIVVIILAILAAIVIPQFSGATTDANEAALDANLNSLRSAIDLYRAQHKNTYPGAAIANGNACASGNKGSNAAGAQALIDQLTMFTDSSGGACSISIAGTTGTPYGPYLRKGFPNEPINNKGALAADISVATTGAVLAPSAATGGWAYDSTTGQIVMNSNLADTKGILYSKH